jgi:hypothetical protein
MGGRRRGGQRQRQFEARLKGETLSLNDEAEASEPYVTDAQEGLGGAQTQTLITPGGPPPHEGGLSGLRQEAAPCASGEYEQAKNSCEKGMSAPL